MPHPMRINILSLRLLGVIIVLMILAGLASLSLMIAITHRSAVEDRMREMVYLAQHDLLEKGYGVAFKGINSQSIWYGDKKAMERAPQAWQRDFPSQLIFATKSLLSTSKSGSVVYAVETNVVVEPVRYGALLVAIPADAFSAMLRHYLIMGLLAVLSLAVLIGFPFALVIEWFVVFPLRKMIADMVAFTHDPYAPRALPEEGESGSIITEAETALARMAGVARNELVQRDKLASLGEGIAKINHDMRNVLSSAVLLSDSLEASTDPSVKKAAPIVSQAIERAVLLCGQILTYIKTPEAINCGSINMRQMVTECAEGIGIKITYTGPDELHGDGGHFFRLIHNLASNASGAGADLLEISVWRAGSLVIMDFADNGPGFAEAAREHLFKPFAGSTRGSSGLGLSIARDIAVAHGGDLSLTRSNEYGSEFRVRLPISVLGESSAHRWW